MPHAKISNSFRWPLNSAGVSGDRNAWTVGSSSSSAKTYVCVLEVAFVMRLAIKRGEPALLERAKWMNGWRASRARVWV